MHDDSWATLYTSFANSGLAGDVSFIAPSSVRDAPESPDSSSPRRGSLPIDSCATDDIAYLKLADESFAFYQTLQPKRDSQEYRSFLSLDLAESQSLRSASLRRKLSRGSKQTSVNSKPLSSIFSSHTFGVHPGQVPQNPPRGRSQRSYDSFAPSVQSPTSPLYADSSFLPIRTTRPPRLPSIPRTPPIDIDTPIEEFVSSLKFSPTKVPDVSRDFSARPRRTPTTCTSSTVSTRTRGINRSKALAQLEGRTPRLQLPPAKSKPVKSDFINLDDDSDDEDLPIYATPEPEDVRTPHTKSIKRRREQPGSRDWLALNSFIDLRSDDEPPSHWRSFIELNAQ